MESIILMLLALIVSAGQPTETYDLAYAEPLSGSYISPEFVQPEFKIPDNCNSECLNRLSPQGDLSVE